MVNFSLDQEFYPLLMTLNHHDKGWLAWLGLMERTSVQLPVDIIHQALHHSIVFVVLLV
jgi:hypothetical protein